MTITVPPVGTLGPKGAEAFQKRGIEPETAAKYGVFTAKKDAGGGTVPSESGNIIVFPFYEYEAVVNAKFRAPGKVFWQTKDGRKTFWNADALDDPALRDGRMPLVITEGEIDALTAIDCGWPLSVSVPDGAPPAAGEIKAESGIDDSTGKFEFIHNNLDRLKHIRRFILAVDSDPPGQRLAEELVRRLSAARCCFVTYPPDCKDLNDVLMRYGADHVRACLSVAKPYPVSGLFQLGDYPDVPPLETFSTGFPMLDPHIQLFTPSFTVITGIPGNGKTNFITQMMIQMAQLHGWRTAVFTPEMPIRPQLRDLMFSMINGDLEQAHQFVHDRIIFIDHGPKDDDIDITLEWIVDRVEDAVYRHGIRMVVIDPWNEIEHAKRRDESMTEYISRGIRMLKRLAKKHNLAIVVLAHPTKEVGTGGKTRVPSLYDIDGSAAWYNKPDFGIVIDRPDPNLLHTAVYVVKVRFRGTGKPGKVMMSFNEETSRYGFLNE